MGYTHYWRQHRDLSQEEWTKITEVVKVLFANLPEYAAGERLSLGDWEGDQEIGPIINDERIIFNGAPEPLEHETFQLNRTKRNLYSYESTNESESVFDFCKTAHKPYDIVVCAVLIVTNTKYPDAWTITSDGTKSHWLPAYEWVCKTLGSSQSWQLPDLQT